MHYWCTKVLQMPLRDVCTASRGLYRSGFYPVKPASITDDRQLLAAGCRNALIKCGCGQAYRHGVVTITSVG